MQDKLFEINIIFKELDRVYRNYAKYCKLPDAAVWILYALRLNQQQYSQRELSKLWFYKKQTINSALRVLQSKHFVRLEPFENSKKNKKIVLTSDGEKYMQEHLDNIVQAEQNALDSLNEKEVKQLVTTVKKYSTFLDDEINKLLSSN